MIFKKGYLGCIETQVFTTGNSNESSSNYLVLYLTDKYVRLPANP